MYFLSPKKKTTESGYSHYQTKTQQCNNFSALAKESIIQVKMKPRGWERLFATYIPDRGLIYTKNSKFKEYKKNDLFEKRTWDLNTEFSKEKQTIKTKLAKKYPPQKFTSLVIREMKMKHFQILHYRLQNGKKI